MSFVQKKNFVVTVAFLACLSMFPCCGSKKISNEQIDADIGNQSLKVKWSMPSAVMTPPPARVPGADVGNQSPKFTEGSTSEWTFKADTDRCFEITDSKYGDGKAEVKANVASSQMDGQENTRMENVTAIKTLSGTVVLNYKDEGGKWVLEKAEGVELRAKAVSVADWKNTFIPKQLSLCDSYEHKNK